MKVLIAEDDPVSAMVLRRALERTGHEVTVAEDGGEAWRTLQEGRPDVLISDWVMPSMDGLELCRRVRELGGAYTYIIMLTGRGRREERTEALEAGADDFLVKPLDCGDLASRLIVARRILDTHNALHGHTRELERLYRELERQNSELAAAATYLTAANQRFSELFEGLPAACYSYDRDGLVQEWNRAAVSLFGWQRNEVVGHPVWEVFREETGVGQERHVCETREVIRRVCAGDSLLGAEFEKRGKDGRRLHLLANILPVRRPDGAITGVICADIDVTERRALERQVEAQLRTARELNSELERQRRELARANAQLSKMVVTDWLTGLSNHRHFREMLEKSFSFARRHNIPFSVVMLDVDLFKAFNDAYGHPAGDDVLRTVAALLCHAVRGHDTVARYGGEEFALLLECTEAEAAHSVAERLRSAVEKHPWPLRPVTASFGISTFGASSPSASELVDQADDALYAAKDAGRNRVIHHADMPAGDQRSRPAGQARRGP